MSEKWNMDTLNCDNALCLKLTNSLENASNTNGTNTVLVEDIEREIHQIIQQENIERLTLSANELSSLPNIYTKFLMNLTYLDLSNNQLKELPDFLSSLKMLQHLRIDSNQFSCIPNVICALISLKSLKAQKNHIAEIPDNVKNLINLEDLDLSSNMLKELPQSCSSLNHLQNLSLADNKFQKIPDCIANGMCALKILDFSQNQHSEINVQPHSTNLTAFYARKNDMCPTFPRWVLYSGFHNLEIVSLDKTKFKKYDLLEEPPSSHVKRLTAKQSNLSDRVIQKIISGMNNLEEIIIGNENLRFHGNTFWQIPIQSLNQPSVLKKVDMQSTGISIIPKTINNYENLSILDVSFNSITWLPDEICSLKHLTSLLIGNNNVALLPEDIGKLVSLKELKANHNHLGRIPDSLKFLNDLQYIDLYNNDFESVPEVIMNLPNLMGLDFEQNYFSTDDLVINRDMHYEILRAVLGDHWQEDEKRINGPKSQQYETFSDNEPGSSSVSSNSSSTDRLGNCSFPVELNDFNDLSHQHWDTSDDSADEFDPNESRVPKKRYYPPFTFYRHLQRVYCPGDTHEKRIITRVRQMLHDGTLIWPSNYEEGQFDDL